MSIRRVIGLFIACLAFLVAIGRADAQTLAIEGDHFTVDTGQGRQAKFLFFFSYFDGMRSSHVNEDLDYLVANVLPAHAATVQLGIRVFPNWWQTGTDYCFTGASDSLIDGNGNIRGDTSPASGRLKKLLDLLDAAKARNIIVDLSFSRETIDSPPTVDKYQAGLVRIATLLRSYPNVIFDLQNEFDNQANPSQHLNEPPQVGDLSSAVTGADPARIVVASSGAVSTALSVASSAHLSAIAFHDARNTGWQNAVSTLVQGDPNTSPRTPGLADAGKPVYFQEPMPWNNGLSICGKQEGVTKDADGTAQDFKTAVAKAKTAGAAAWGFFTRQTFRLSDPATTLQSLIEGSAGEHALLTGNMSLGLSAESAGWPVQMTLNITRSGLGGGVVTSDPQGVIYCGVDGQGPHNTCAKTFPQESPATLSLIATPVDGSKFVGWTSSNGTINCSAQTTCAVTVTGDVTIDAQFDLLPVNDTAQYYHLDAAGSVRVITKDSGEVLTRYDYLPFGEDFPAPSVVDVRRFASKERDEETSFDYFGARYYTSGTGRFTTVDPVFAQAAAVANPQLWNRYAYDLNNPLRFVDPDGRCIWDACAAEGTAVYMVGAAAIASTVWLVSPSGQAAVSQVVHDTRTMVTTAAGAIGSWFQSDNRPGTLGKPDHRATVEAEAARIAGTPEVRIETPNGRKGSRRADAVGTNPDTGETEIVQVYRPTAGGNIPQREKNAAEDIEKATGVKPTMVPVRPVPPKKPLEQEDH